MEITMDYLDHMDDPLKKGDIVMYVGPFAENHGEIGLITGKPEDNPKTAYVQFLDHNVEMYRSSLEYLAHIDEAEYSSCSRCGKSVDPNNVYIENSTAICTDCLKPHEIANAQYQKGMRRRAHEPEVEKSATAWMRRQAHELDPSISDNESINQCARIISDKISPKGTLIYEFKDLGTYEIQGRQVSLILHSGDNPRIEAVCKCCKSKLLTFPINWNA